MNYYDEVLKKIETSLNSNDLHTARLLIEEELSMPYIPEDVERKLISLKKEVEAENKTSKAISDEQLVAYLCGDKEQQLIAANSLADKNLREYIDIIQDYFNREDGFDNAKVYIVSLLIDQELNHEFHLIKDGVHYDFIPRYLYKFEELDAFRECVNLINQNYSDNPSYMNLMLEEVIKRMFDYLPLQYEDFEGEMLFKDVESYVLDAFNKEI